MSIKYIDRQTGAEHQYRFARSCKEAFGSDFETDNHCEPDNWRWTWPVVILYTVVAIGLLGWSYAHAAPRYEIAPNQQTVVVEVYPINQQEK